MEELLKLIEDLKTEINMCVQDGTIRASAAQYLLKIQKTMRDEFGTAQQKIIEEHSLQSKSVEGDSVIEKTIQEIKTKFSIINEELIDSIIRQMLWHISEAYGRGLRDGKENKADYFITEIEKLESMLAKIKSDISQ